MNPAPAEAQRYSASNSVMRSKYATESYSISIQDCHTYYHTSNSSKCMGVNGKASQLHTVCKKPYFLLQVTRESVSVLQVTRESVSVLQVTRESVSGTASHVHCVWMCSEIEGSYDKIIIIIVPSYTRKISLVCCHWHLITIQTATNLWYFSA